MNICCSGVKIILIDNILRTKLLRQLMTFLTVQLLFDKLAPYVFNVFVLQDLLDQKFFETYGIIYEKSRKFVNYKLSLTAKLNLSVMLTYRYLCIKGIKGDMKALGPRFISQPRGKHEYLFWIIQYLIF
jgi:hypothetical protein